MFTKRLKNDVVKFISTRLVFLENVKAGIRGTSCTRYKSLDSADAPSGGQTLARFKAKNKFWLERTELENVVSELENVVPGDPSYDGESVGPVWGTILYGPYWTILTL